VASLSQGRTAAAQCGLFTHKSVPVIFEPPCKSSTISEGAVYAYYRIKVQNYVLPVDTTAQPRASAMSFIRRTELKKTRR